MSEKKNDLPKGMIRWSGILRKKDLNRFLDYCYTERLTVSEGFSHVMDNHFKIYDGELLKSPKRK